MRDLTPGMGVCEFALASKLRDEGRLEELRELLKKYPSDPPLTNPPLKSWYGKPVA